MKTLLKKENLLDVLLKAKVLFLVVGFFFVTPYYVHAQKPDKTMREFSGVVPHIFFHSLIIYPERAYHAKKKKVDLYKNNMITVAEFKKILQQLYDNNFILIDSRALYTIDKNGNIAKKSIYIPIHKKPLILSLDDLNYYASNSGNGFADKLVVVKGKVYTQVTTPEGKKIITRDGDVIPIVDQFIEEHPDFSLSGAKGIIGVTGFEGILGYRTQLSGAEGENEKQQVQQVITALKETGWIFASHSFSHENGFLNGDIPLKRMEQDTELFKSQVEPLIGPTAIFIIPFGKMFPQGDPRIEVLIKAGFRVIYGVGLDQYQKYFSNYLASNRINIDGYRLVHNKKWLKKNLGID